ncbi:MAG: hypothetical protein G3M70_09150 [Candidatus Nitronauta litoralis]|uniref:TNase-like domain-containing protein n=1 Tax=Candidatus Nitronauta litoralis TaxID=2705533 RepID=A0A7T0G054_9BACT|nr:MAG: hypothetical protein G3M70_09150 [Candidatus Nitronauta litoralis]
MIEIATWLLSFALVSAPGVKIPDSGVVVQVHSGDRFTIRSEGHFFKVRLAHIYAPHLTQPFGDRSKEFLEKMVLQHRVKIQKVINDKFNRLVVEAQLPGGLRVNDEMVAAGMAWHYRVAEKPKKYLAKLEHQAFSHKLGFWVQRNPVPPWEFARERLIPPPPVNDRQADYDRIFHYGLIGDRKTRTYKWPECHNYRKPKKPVIFPSILDAEASGFRASRDCHLSVNRNRS